MLRTHTPDLYRQARRAAVWGFAVTLGLGLAKLIGGWAGHSLALLSDSVHSLGDAIAAATVWVALRWAERPADLEHPYGHARVETIAASNVALLLLISGLWIGWTAIGTWDEPSPTPQGYTLAIAIVGLFLNEANYRYAVWVARRTGSRAVAATAWEQRLDVLGSGVVVVGLAAAYWGGPGWHAADHGAALVVSVIILWAGGKLFWGSLQDLMDRQADPAVVDEVRRTAASVPGVLGVEKSLVRRVGLEYLVDIHVEVDPEATVRDGHTIAHAVKDRLLAGVSAVKDVLVHIEPSPHGDRSHTPTASGLPEPAGQAES